MEGSLDFAGEPIDDLTGVDWTTLYGDLDMAWAPLSSDLPLLTPPTTLDDLTPTTLDDLMPSPCDDPQGVLGQATDVTPPSPKSGRYVDKRESCP
jgi:hypothetical protein